MVPLNSIAVQLPAIDPRSIQEIDADIATELEFHLAMRTQDNVRAGMSPPAAREEAIVRFGDFDHIRQVCRRTVLGERIMLQRIQAGLTILLLLAVIAMGASMIRAQRANNAALVDLATAVKQLSERPETKAGASPTSPDWLAERPHVVETNPAANSANVDPATTEIRVTFNKPMTDGSWSWVRNSAFAFPESAGDVHYADDGTTCVMPVKLEPGTKYVVWLNSENYQNFKDSEGRPAVPYLLSFTTSK